MKGIMFLLFILVCHAGLSRQTCSDCKCCNGGACDSEMKCTNGCIAGNYGDKCTYECLENCKTCDDGYACTECKTGYYGSRCSEPCGKGCLNNTCDLSGGKCTCKSTNYQEGRCHYCSVNMYGDYCNNTCPENCGSCTSDTYCSWCKNTLYYGTYCQHNCSYGCYSFKCSKGTGHCFKGCKSGYTGDKCDRCSPGLYGTYCNLNCKENCSSCVSNTNCIECKDGLYGNVCSLLCPSGCNGKCSISNGRCLNCKQGYYGEYCTCIDGTYGVNCSKLCNDSDVNCRVCFSNELRQYGGCIQCNSGYYSVISPETNYSTCIMCPSNCREYKCSASGVCTNGCLPGKWGDECSNDCVLNCLECRQSDGKCLACSRNTFSEDCSQSCGRDCSTAFRGRVCAGDTGKCLQGCKTNTSFGEQCENECNDTCVNYRCNWKTGHCLEGCVMNYYGSFCENKCASACQSNESKRVCDDVKGHCLFGCIDGLHGPRCAEKCSGQCKNTTCNQITAECLQGCINGNTGPSCDQETVSDQGGHTTNALIGASFGSGLSVAVSFTLAIIIWRWRQRKSTQTDVEGENIHVSSPAEDRPDDYENRAPVSYEDLNSRDETVYSQISSSQ